MEGVKKERGGDEVGGVGLGRVRDRKRIEMGRSKKGWVRRGEVGEGRGWEG